MRGGARLPMLPGRAMELPCRLILPGPDELPGLRTGGVLAIALAPALAAAVLAAALAADSPPQVVQMELKGQEDTEPKLGYGNSQWLHPHDEAQEKLIEQPTYKSDKQVYYAARYGDAEDNVYTFVVDESAGPGNGYDVVYVDANNDNRVDEKEERFQFQLGTTRKTIPLRVRLLVTSGGVESPYHVSFSAFPYTDEKHPVEKIHANLRNSSHYGAEVLFRGKRRMIAVSDLDSNGLFNDVEQRLFRGDRFFIDLNGDGKFQTSRERQESYPYGRYTLIEGDWYSIAASPDGSRVEIAAADPPLGKVEAPPRIATASLYSATQPLRLEFANGPTFGVAGTYRLQSVRLLARDESDPRRGLPGTFGDNPPQVTIREGKTNRLVAGSPLEVGVLAVPKGDEGMLEFSLSITGIGGEKYRWLQRSSSSPKAGFDIVDPSGKQIASQKFDYG